MVAFDRTREVLEVSGNIASDVEAVSKSLLALLAQFEVTRPNGNRNGSNQARDNGPLDEVVNNFAAHLRIKRTVEPDEFDVFLCHNSSEKRDVMALGERLKEHGILPWLDEWNIQPGGRWQKALEQQISKIKSVAVIIGESQIGPWQDIEIDAFLREFVRRGCPVIPVMLPSCIGRPELPTFLSAFMWVDFRKLSPDPLRSLIWGITGRKAE